MVPVGGIVILDDILSHKPAQDSWEDFQRDQGFREELVRVNKDWDSHGAWFVKTQHVEVDFSKMHLIDVDE